jgi:hypothetical protein
MDSVSIFTPFKPGVFDSHLETLMALEWSCVILELLESRHACISREISLGGAMTFIPFFLRRGKEY